MSKIKCLTTEQEALFPVFKDKWIKYGLSTESADREMAQDGIKEAYLSAGLNPPDKFIWLDSPLQGCIASYFLSQVRDQVRYQVRYQVRDRVPDQVRIACFGSHGSGWLSFYDFFDIVCGIDIKKIAGLMKAAKSCGWWWPFERLVICTERPCSLHRDEQGRLHNSDTKALEYPDGWGIFAWHGVRVPEKYYNKNPDAAEILSERNAEVRRALIERMGIDRFMIACNPSVIDEKRQAGTDKKNQLLSIDLPDDPDGKLVAMKLNDPSTGMIYFIRVPPSMNLMDQALAWSFNVEDYSLIDEG